MFQWYDVYILDVAASLNMAIFNQHLSPANYDSVIYLAADISYHITDFHFCFKKKFLYRKNFWLVN